MFKLTLLCYILTKSNFVLRNPLAQMEEEKREHDLKMKKMESEMEQVRIFSLHDFLVQTNEGYFKPCSAKHE